MRSYEFARKIENKQVVVDEEGKEVLSYPEAQLPEYQTKYSAGADFFAAKDVVVPSIWKQVLSSISAKTSDSVGKTVDHIMSVFGYTKEREEKDLVDIKPTIIHTGIKANMNDDEVLEIYNRSSNPKKLGLVLANSVGVIDKDYYGNEDNDGEIMFAYYNFKLHDVTVKKGDRIGQGVFKKVLRPEVGLRVKDDVRKGGLGSTNISEDSPSSM